MSNLGNPNCCCEVGLHYPWLTFETNTFGANMDAAHPNQIVRTPAISLSTPPSPNYLYTYCNFSTGTDDCNSPCYEIPTIDREWDGTAEKWKRIKVDNTDGCWGACNDTSCWCDIPKDSTALKHYIDLDYPDVLNWVDQGPVEGGVGSNNAYPELSTVMYDGIRYMATGEPDDADTPREPPPNRLNYEIDGDFGGWAANTPPLTRHDSVHTLGLRKKGVSYAWHLTQDVREPFNKNRTYQSGERVYVQWSCASGATLAPDGDHCFEWGFKTDDDYETSAPMSHYPNDCDIGKASSTSELTSPEWDSGEEYEQGDSVYQKGREWAWLASTKLSGPVTTPDPATPAADNYWYPVRFYCENFQLTTTPYNSLTGTVGPSLFDMRESTNSGWERDVATPFSQYTLNLLDWSQPAAWITGEQCSNIVSKRLTLRPSNNPNRYIDGYLFDEDCQAKGNGWSDLGLRESYMADSAALGFPYQGNRVFLHTTLARSFGLGTTNRGWGRQHRVVAFQAKKPIQCIAPGPFCVDCGGVEEIEELYENVWTWDMGGDEWVQTISADDSTYTYFKVELQSSLKYNPWADSSVYKNETKDDEKCGKIATCGSDSNPATLLNTEGGQNAVKPYDEDFNRYKVYLQQWDRDGDSITYSQPEDSEENGKYPDCKINFAVGSYRVEELIIPDKTFDADGERQYTPSCDKIYNGSRQPARNDSVCPRVADIVYFPELWQIPNTKKLGSRSWEAMDATVDETNTCDVKKKFGITKLETYRQPYAIAPRVPLRGISIQSERWLYTSSDGKFVEAERENGDKYHVWEKAFEAPKTCIISYENCYGKYLDEKCFAGEPKSDSFSQGTTELEPPNYVENAPGWYRLPQNKRIGNDEGDGTSDGQSRPGWNNSFPIGFPPYDGGKAYAKPMAGYVVCNWRDKAVVKPWNGYGGVDNNWGAEGSAYRCQSLKGTETLADGNTFYNYEGKYTTADLCRPCGTKLGTFSVDTQTGVQHVIDECNEYWYGTKAWGAADEYYKEGTTYAMKKWSCKYDGDDIVGGGEAESETCTESVTHDEIRKPACIGGASAVPSVSYTIGGALCDKWVCPGAGGAEDICLTPAEQNAQPPHILFSNLDLPTIPGDYGLSVGEEYISYGQACVGKYGDKQGAEEGFESFRDVQKDVTDEHPAGKFDSMMVHKFLAKHCGYCIDNDANDGSINADIGWNIGPGRGKLNPPAYTYNAWQGGEDFSAVFTPQGDSSYTATPGECATRRMDKYCTKTEDLDHEFTIVARLVAGTAGVGGVADEGQASGSLNKRFLLKSSKTLFESEFDWTTRVYNWQNQPHHGISLYGYDAGTHGGRAIDLVAMTTIEAQSVEYEYHPDDPKFLPGGVGWCVNETPCMVKNWRCKCTRKGGEYGNQNKFFQRYDLRNKLIIGDSNRPMYEFEGADGIKKVRDRYDCGKKYETGDVVVYRGKFWSAIGNAQGEMPDPKGHVDDDVEHNFFDCTQVYHEGNKVCHPDSDKNYYTYTFAEDFTDQGVEPFDRCKQYHIEELPHSIVCNPTSDGSKYRRYTLKETTPNPKGIWMGPTQEDPDRNRIHNCTQSYAQAELVSGVDGQVWEAVLSVNPAVGECLEIFSGAPTFDGMATYVGGERWDNSTAYKHGDQVRSTGHGSLDGLRYNGVFSASTDHTNILPGTNISAGKGATWEWLGEIPQVLHGGKIYEPKKSVYWGMGGCEGEPSRNPEPLIDFIRRGGVASEYKFTINSCSFNVGDWEEIRAVNWEPVGDAAGCDNGCYTKDCSDPQCCDFNEDNWNVVTDKEYNCCGLHTCCEFDETQWTKGDSCDECPNDCCPFDSNLWTEQGSAGKVAGATDQLWYKAYYHRDFHEKEKEYAAQCKRYNPSGTYTLGDQVVYSGIECGWYVDRFYTYQATGSMDPIGPFEYKCWTDGVTERPEGTTSNYSAAPVFEVSDYPNMYPYDKYDRTIYNNTLYEAYPFYCTTLDFNENMTYGSMVRIRDPQPMVVADDDGKIRSDPDHGKLYLWIMEPTVDFKQCVKDSPFGDKWKCWYLPANDDWQWETR